MRRAVLAAMIGLACALAGAGALAPARATTAPLVVRVGVEIEQPSVALAADGPVQMLAPDTGVTVTLAGSSWTVVPAAAGLRIAGAEAGPVVRLTPGVGVLRVDGRAYRGVIELHRTAAGRVTAIDELPLEQYLYGVIQGEIDPRWPPQAVEAQAVAARTLAVEGIAKAHAGAGVTGYDLAATTGAQVYLGVAAEDPAATAAVAATRGLVVTYEDRPIFAAYHSDSGGHTENSENVWRTVYPYLRGVPDPYALDAPHVNWTAALPLAAIRAALGRGGVAVPALDGVAPGRVTPWGRAITVRLAGGDGPAEEMNANRFRLLVGAAIVRSAMFTTARRGADVVFHGKGSGHGVGLDQWGARAMALRGFTFEQILKYYYTGVAIEQLY